VSNNKNLAIPAEAMWPTEYDTKRAWGTSIKKQPGENGQQKTGHLTAMEIAVKCATWKYLLDNQGEDEAYKFASRNALGGILVFARFFDPEKKAFAQDPCFMVIAPPSTGMDDRALTLMLDEVWGDDKLVHLSGLPVTDTENDPLSPV
jgi:hypothetical protein